MLEYSILFTISYLFSRIQYYYLSGFVLILAAIIIIFKNYHKENKISLKTIFSFSFILGQGISSLKLSYLQKDWNIKTYLSFYVIIIVFNLVYTYFENKNKSKNISFQQYFFISEKEAKKVKLFRAIVILGFLSISAFFFEAIKLSFIPILKYGTPHAYSYFHISGIHYFTVICILIPGISLLYFQYKKEDKSYEKEDFIVYILSFISIIMPILMVSRFQFLFSLFLLFLTAIFLKKKIKKLYIGIFVVAIFLISVFISILRSHSIEYLNEIFEMKKNYPIFISQPYIYIANNYDNFNELTRNIKEYSKGIKSLFPIFVLSGLKFKFASLFNFPLYITKQELTTLTIIYDAYYDFGIFGVGVFAFILAYFSEKLERIRSLKNTFIVVYSQVYIYFSLSFFTTWFSNPSTWFYLIISIIVCLYVEVDIKKFVEKFMFKRKYNE